MDVPVRFNSGHRWRRAAKKPSVLGGGLLERARSTTLALLGATTAVGLAMVGLALNQSWPLIADSPLPVTPPRHEAVGKATVAAEAIADVPDSLPARAGGSRGSGSARSASGGDSGAAPAPAGSPPTASAELVVAPSAPAEPQGDAPRKTHTPTPSPSPEGKTSQPPAASAPVSEPTQPEPAAQSPPAVETSPPATSSQAPVDSSVPPWSNGKGHAYGRDKSTSSDDGQSAGGYDHDWDEEDWDDDDDDDHWDDEDHDHHWSGGHHGS
jgi:hypothetical protein